MTPAEINRHLRLVRKAMAYSVGHVHGRSHRRLVYALRTVERLEASLRAEYRPRGPKPKGGQS